MAKSAVDKALRDARAYLLARQYAAALSSLEAVTPLGTPRSAAEREGSSGLRRRGSSDPKDPPRHGSFARNGLRLPE